MVDEPRVIAPLRGVDDGVSPERHEVLVVVLEPGVLLTAPAKLPHVQHLAKRRENLRLEEIEGQRELARKKERMWKVKGKFV